MNNFLRGFLGQPPEPELCYEEVEIEGLTPEEIEQKLAEFSEQTGCPFRIEHHEDGSMEVIINNCK